MEYRTLGSGRAAMEVSALGFGCMGLTYNRSQSPDKKECIRIIHEAVDRDVTLFDTAIIYGPLDNELLAGEALAPYKGRVNLTTKFGHEVINGKGTGRQDSSRATVRRYCEESLRRLRLDSIPLFYQHRFDRNTPIEEVAETINLHSLTFSVSNDEWLELETAVAAIPVRGDRYNAEQQKQVGF